MALGFRCEKDEDCATQMRRTWPAASDAVDERNLERSRGVMTATSPRTRDGSVQSIERAFELMEHVARNRGAVGLSQLAQAAGLPLPTAHRIMRTLIGLGYVRQEASRRYALGPRLIPLGDAAVRSLGESTNNHLRKLATDTGESANLAVLQGDEVLYVAQIAGKHSMRMFTEPGRRVMPHCTAVGKAVLAGLSEAQVRGILERTGMPRFTPATIVRVAQLLAELDGVRQRGYAIDEGEQELGVRCVAVQVPSAPTPTAISVSAPATRLSDSTISKILPALSRAARAIGKEMSSDDEEG
jgi:IclR family transcriptional regulator, acetate operon repressor